MPNKIRSKCWLRHLLCKLQELRTRRSTGSHPKHKQRMLAVAAASCTLMQRQAAIRLLCKGLNVETKHAGSNSDCPIESKS